MQKLLNLGCGSRFSKDPGWVNLDVIHATKGIISHDLSKGIPFAAQTFDVVYHSQLLEHFSREEGSQLTQECFRILKPRGIVRIAVPDLANTCRLYLELLEKIESGDRSCLSKYDWIILELLDQTTRAAPGGEMEKYLKRKAPPDKEFISERIGTVAKEIWKSADIATCGLKEKNNKTNFKHWVVRVRKVPYKLRRLLMAVLLSKKEMKAIELGLFRLSGEVHQWAYDKYSLRRILEDAGFVKVQQYSARESGILEWHKYLLDVDADGSVHAPSSIYMEGVKPA